ncbi:39095_t:CDS:2, partial [Gigaspora margarita]
MSSPPFSDTEESNVTLSTISTSSTTTRKKRKASVKISYSNKSYTSYFFHIDKDNVELAYCKICGNTSNMIAHLRDKHNIIKDNYTDFLDEHNE